LPGQARRVPRAAARHPAAPAARARRVLPAGRLFGGQRPARRRVLPLAHHRARGGVDPAVAVLRGATGGAAPGAAVLRQGAAHPGCRDRAPVPAVAGRAGWTKIGPMDNLRISLVQGATLWHDPAGNRAYYGELMAPLRGITDLVLLPETFTSGFSNEAI